jgi:hypothetical protein
VCVYILFFSGLRAWSTEGTEQDAALSQPLKPDEYPVQESPAPSKVTAVKLFL